MNKLYYVWISIVISTLFLSCEQRKSYQNHLTYLEALNQYKQVCEKINQYEDLNFSAQFIPTEKYLLQRYKTLSSSKDSIQFKEDLNDLDSKMFFSLKLSDDNRGILGDSKNMDANYYSKLQYFIQPAQRDIQLIHGVDTFLCTDYHFERYYDYAPYNKILLAFDKDSVQFNKDMTLQFNYPFSMGSNKLSDFHFNIKDINNLPELNI